MTLARLQDSEMKVALAKLCGYEDISVCHTRSTFLGYLSLCQLYSIQFVVPVDNCSQCLVCLKHTDSSSVFDCACHQVQLSLLQDLRCWCNCLICECDDIPPMCLDPDQLDLIHRQIRFYYGQFSRIGILILWNDEMSYVFIQVDAGCCMRLCSTAIRVSQFEPP